MTLLKEKLMTLIELMPEKEAEILFADIQSKFILIPKRGWDDIEEEEPDEFDLEMIRQIKDGGNDFTTFNKL